jgi:RNA polymerase sigma factor (sigma-70 family)
MGLTSRDDFRQLGRLRGKRRTALRQRIIEENINLVYAIAKQRFRRIDPDELIGVGCEGLMRAVDRFDPERGYEFSTYASRAIWSHMLRSLSLSKARPTAELFCGLSVPERGGDRLLAQEVAELIGALPDRQRRAVWLRFWRDAKLEDIGKEMGISKERARQLIMHGVTRLREMYGLPRSRDGARNTPKKPPETGRHATQTARPVPRHSQKRQRPRKRVLAPLLTPGSARPG